MPADPDTGEAAGPKAPATLQTVERALSFLECVATSEVPLTVRDVADRLGVNLTTCYHLFNTLSARRYIERAPDLTLRVGLKATLLSEGYRRGFSSQRLMGDLVDGLARVTSESSYLSVYRNNEVILSALAEGTQSIRVAGLYVGLTGQEHLRSSGRAVLAFLDQEERESLVVRALSTLPPAQRPAIREHLDQELASTRARGWAFDDQEFAPGIAGIAAPFFSRRGSVLGGVGIWAPVDRVYEHKDELVRHVLETSLEASNTLGATQ